VPILAPLENVRRAEKDSKQAPKNPQYKTTHHTMGLVPQRPGTGARRMHPPDTPPPESSPRYFREPDCSAWLWLLIDKEKRATSRKLRGAIAETVVLRGVEPRAWFRTSLGDGAVVKLDAAHTVLDRLKAKFMKMRIDVSYGVTPHSTPGWWVCVGAIMYLSLLWLECRFWQLYSAIRVFVCALFPLAGQRTVSLEGCQGGDCAFYSCKPSRDGEGQLIEACVVTPPPSSIVCPVSFGRSSPENE
jgi:hypothetical protein